MRITNLNKSFGNKVLFKDFSLDVKEGSFVFITGPSGCGKTTLLNMIAGLEKPDSGKIEGFEKAAYLFQEPRLLMWKTALENVALVSNSETSEKYLEAVGLSEEKNKYPNELSGGQRQRIALARAFAFDSKVILLDEPFQNLDEKLHDRLVRSFLDLCLEQKKTVLWVSHNSEEEQIIRDVAQDCIKVSL